MPVRLRNFFRGKAAVSSRQIIVSFPMKFLMSFVCPLFNRRRASAECDDFDSKIIIFFCSRFRSIQFVSSIFFFSNVKLFLSVESSQKNLICRDKLNRSNCWFPGSSFPSLKETKLAFYEIKDLNLH